MSTNVFVIYRFTGVASPIEMQRSSGILPWRRGKRWNQAH